MTKEQKRAALCALAEALTKSLTVGLTPAEIRAVLPTLEAANSQFVRLRLDDSLAAIKKKLDNNIKRAS